MGEEKRIKTIPLRREFYALDAKWSKYAKWQLQY
jgi:hypothetical protein